MEHAWWAFSLERCCSTTSFATSWLPLSRHTIQYSWIPSYSFFLQQPDYMLPQRLGMLGFSMFSNQLNICSNYFQTCYDMLQHNLNRVDCFDACNANHPYLRRLSSHQQFSAWAAQLHVENSREDVALERSIIKNIKAARVRIPFELNFHVVFREPTFISGYLHGLSVDHNLFKFVQESSLQGEY